MKIAFLFLTMDNINWPIFWNYYLKGHEKKFNIYVHPKYPNKVSIPWMKKNIIHNLVDTQWGIIVNAYINLMEEAMKDKRNQKFITISESCIPYKSFDELYEFLKNDNIKTSYIKSLPIKNYDWTSRIKTQKNYKNIKYWRKHLARFCLSRYHVHILLQKKQELHFFYNMHVGDEFFLSSIPKDKYMKDFAITYDNWTYIEHEIKKINQKIEKLYIEIENNKDLSDNKKKNINKKINDYKIQKTKLSPNPKSYIKVYKKDFKDADNSNAFFWRKFPKNSEIIHFKNNIFKKI
jgi:hypothetical protein